MDPLEDPDPAAVGAAAAVETLLRCYVRETGIAVPADGPLRLNLHGLELTVPVLYRSPTGWHRFGHPVFSGFGRHLRCYSTEDVAQTGVGGGGGMRMRG